MDYLIIAQENIDRLEDVVNEYTAAGWKPTGGIVIDFSRNIYFQTLIRTPTAEELMARRKPKAKE